MMKKMLLIVFMFLCLLILRLNNCYAQVYTWPQNRDYAYGYQQTVSAATTSSSLADSWYTSWKASWVESCGAGIYRVKDGGGSTFSEGIGYGMLLAAYRGDKVLFDGLWSYYKNNRNINGLMDWCQSNCAGTNCGNNAATDGDLDAAMALIIANCQWPSTTTPHNYVTDATTLITKIKDHEFTTCSGRTIQKPGDVFGGCNCTNPSYFAPGYYRAFAQFIPSQSAFWTTAANDAYWLLDQIDHPTTGLIPAWTDQSGGLTGGSGDCNSIAAAGGGQRYEYQFDAARTPWRIVTDYLWWGTPEAATWLSKVTAWVKSRPDGPDAGSTGSGIEEIIAGYKTDGTPNVSYKNSAFTGSFAVGAMAVNQTDANEFYSWWTNNSVTSGSVGTKLDDAPYFQNSLRTMYLFLASGNFWYPCTSGPPAPTCLQPSLGSDISLCGVSFPKVLNSNTPIAANVMYSWKKDNVLVVTNSSSANTYSMAFSSDAGIWVVLRDSTDGIGNVVCTKSDTILVSNTLPIPNLGLNKNICTPAYYHLTPSNVASFPSTTSWQWSKDGVIISDQPSYKLEYVRKVGIYKLTASISGCTSTSDEVEITSDIPSPDDACIPAPGALTLSISNAAAGPYQWYHNSANGSSLGNGTSFTTSISAIDTFYVQDMSAASGTVGPTTDLGSITNWGINTGNKLLFTANQNFVLNSMKIPFQVYDASITGNITIQIQDNSNTIRAAYTSDNLNPAGNGYQFIQFTFSGGASIDAASWGSNLKMVLSAKTINADPLWNNVSTAAYAYNSSPASIVSITGKEGGNGGANEYMYFYDWEITTGTPCDRIPVIASIGNCGALPVELIYFNGKVVDGQVYLTWKTLAESNNKSFSIERSVDENFYVIGNVKGIGNSSSTNQYSFIDQYPEMGKSYYRIAQYDVDGNIHYSNIIYLENVNNEILEVKPNPFNNEMIIWISSSGIGNIHLKIYDMAGKIQFHTNEFSTNEKIEIGAGLVKGVYVLEVIFNNTVYNRKIIKQ